MPTGDAQGVLGSYMYQTNVPGGDIQPDLFNRLLIDKSYLFKVEVRHAHFDEFDPSYNVIDIRFDEKIISQFKETNSIFFLVQTDVTLGL
ncbi:hypothetical protein DM860_002071 [Cuscuta australis]|uniref:Uncharacterized protein n=1 Tax=Cuscuta australis TaxID=267555 RepID=A0A328DX46_9ASTE|nr:hypothetical protein DM860_002071 [Cuscuta australis]